MLSVRLLAMLQGLSLILVTILVAQQNQSVDESVKLIAIGQAEAGRILLPRPGDVRKPDLYYLRGLMAADGRVAMQFFSVIVDSFATNEWADDALARMLEYQDRTGDRRAAHSSLTQLRTQYPASPYIRKAYFRDAAYLPGDSSLVASRTDVESEFSIQVGAFAVPENAKKYQKIFQAEGYETSVYENFLDGKNLLYLVWVGSFRAREDADETIQSIRTKHRINPILRTRMSWTRAYTQ